nr:MAG TPA: hypothetical protein [Caudoviricetes sp.]
MIQTFSQEGCGEKGRREKRPDRVTIWPEGSVLVILRNNTLKRSVLSCFILLENIHVKTALLLTSLFITL